LQLLFLPPFSPELQPAEHLWPLTNTVLVNQHFAGIDELEDVQVERCATLQLYDATAYQLEWSDCYVC
jgi:transposase